MSNDSVFLIPVSTFILAVFLLTPASVLADKLGPDLAAAEKVRLEKPALSARMQALLDGISSPEQALEKARDYQQGGQFGLAKIVLLHGIELAAAEPEKAALLTNEMEYRMPLLQAKELLVLGQPDQAVVILEDLTEKFSGDQKRIDEIAALRGALNQSRLLQTARRNNEQDVTRDVRKRLSRYYSEHGAFPGYVELNRILPAGDKALQNYEVIYYKSVPNAYRMVLRNLHNKENLLKIEATGLIK